MQGKSNKLYDPTDIYYYNVHRSAETILQLQNRYTLFATLKDTVVNDIFQKHGYTVTNISVNEKNFWTWHVIYFVETKQQGVLVFRGAVWLREPEYYMELEKQFGALARKAGIPTSFIIAADCTRSEYDFDYQIMELLPWLDVETEWEWTQEEYDSLSYQVGETIAKEYTMPVKWRWRFINSSYELIGAKSTAFDYITAYVEYDLSVIQQANILSQDACVRIKNYFDQQRDIINFDKQAYLVHHDMADHNMRYDKSSYQLLAIYDWENAVACDPISELGSACTRVCHYPRLEQMKQWFLDSLWKVPNYFEEKIALYLLRTMLWKASFAIKWKRFSPRHQKLMNVAFEKNGLQIDREFASLGSIEL